MKTQNPLILSVLVFLASLTAAQAFTWHVDAKGTADAGGSGPADALPSLQAAIDRAGDGDLIVVAEGEYGPVSVASPRSLTIRSAGDPENTILAGDGETRCATFADETGAAAWNVTLEGFTLAGGADDSDAGGGGVLGGNLVNCILRDNTAVRGGGASGSRLENCLLSGNAAALVGGGAFDSELVNCTVAGNHADGTGGGVCECKLANSIVWANDSPDGVDAAGCFATFSCTTPLLEGEGNFAADPGFVDAETGDWRLAPGSPCLDAGDGAFCTSGTDLAGKGRVAGTGVDLGACEGAAANSSESRGVPKNAGQTVTIVFDPNGGTCNTATMTFRVGEHYAGFPRPTRPGYIYAGWYTSPTGGVSITGKTVASASHKKFYARWCRAVTIVFDPNGGTCDTATMTFRVGAHYAGFPRPTRPGYLYAGWYTSPTGGVSITGKTVASASHKKFYAHWCRAVTVAFDPNGGTCKTAKKTFRVGVKYSGLPTPTRAGCLFTGWYTAAQGGTRIDGNTIASTSHGKFYAHWVRAVTVSFNPNGGVCSVAKKQYGVGLTYASLPVPTRSGCTFAGWYTPDGTLVKTTTTVTAARTNLVAHWFKNLTFHPVGDSMTYGVRTRNNPLLNGASASAVAKIGNQGWRGFLKQTLVPWGKTKSRAVLFLGKHPQSSYAGNVPHDGYCGENASSYARNHPAACSVKADVQIVFLGMNDALSISRKDDPGSYVGPFKDGYDRVLMSLNAGLSTPLTILVTEPKVTSLVTKHNRLYKPGPINDVIGGYINPFIRSRKESNVLVLDLQTLYSDSSYTDDGFHLSEAGNKVVAARLANLVEGFWKGK